MIVNFFLKRMDWIQRKLKKSYLKKHRGMLLRSDVTIISNNCWGGLVYKDLGIAYNTPFVNMYIHAPCYIKLLSDLRNYLAHPLKFTPYSKYKTSAVNYPIGLLDDIEIHFIHYKNPDEVLEKWTSRIQRMTDHLMVVLSERDLCSLKEIEAFDQLPFTNKICFTRRRLPFQSVVPIPVFRFLNELPPADVLSGFTYSRIDIVAYINRVISGKTNFVTNH